MNGGIHAFYQSLTVCRTSFHILPNTNIKGSATHCNCSINNVIFFHIVSFVRIFYLQPTEEILLTINNLPN